MTQALHSQARTTHLLREEIRNSTLPQAELARLHNVTGAPQKAADRDWSAEQELELASTIGQ